MQKRQKNVLLLFSEGKYCLDIINWPELRGTVPCCGLWKKFKHLSGGGNLLLIEPALCTGGGGFICVIYFSSHKATPILQMNIMSHAARMWHN